MQPGKVSAAGGFSCSSPSAVSSSAGDCSRKKNESAKSTWDRSISAGSFAFRPAAFCYLVTVALLFFFGVVATDWHLWFAAALSYINFNVTAVTPPGTAAFLGHFWTLAVEEHFYILLSLRLLVTFHERRILLLTIFISILLAGQEFGADHGEFLGELSIRRTYWIIQFLLVPALFARDLVRLPKIRSLASRFLKPWVASVITLLMMLGHQWSEKAKVLLQGWASFSVIDFLVVNQTYLFYGFAFLVVAVMLNPRSLSTRFFELPPLRFFGRLSYSIYLWHILFFIPIYLGNLVHSPVLIALSARPWKYIATITTALLSYHLIEKPLIRFGHRIAPPATQGHPDLLSAPPYPSATIAVKLPN